MAYVPTVWQNNEVTPVNAENLNKQEAGIVLADANATDARTRQDVVEAELLNFNNEETIRIANEVARSVSEATRVTQNTSNSVAEALRVSNETVRETDYNTYKNVMIAESNVAALQNNINVNSAALANIAYPITQNYFLSNGGTDWRLAIQKAIDDGYGVVLIPKGIYDVSLNMIDTGKGTGIAINLRDNLLITGVGTIRSKNGNNGASGMIFGNISSTIKNCIIENITIDGNRDNVTGGIDNAVMFSATNCKYESVNSINSFGTGLMFRGLLCTNNHVINCFVDNCKYIGIQCADNINLHIMGNTVTNTGDNGIDVEGNDPLNIGLSQKIIIHGNILKNNGAGIFLESSGLVTISDNFIDDWAGCAIFLNRITSGSFYNLIHGNHFNNVDNTKDGINFNSSVGKTKVYNNFFNNMKNAIVCSTGITNNVITDNYFSNITKYLVSVQKLANSLVKSVIKDNYYENGQSPNGFPKTTNVKDSRMFNVNFNPTLSLESNLNLRDDYFYKTDTLINSVNWGAYSIYYNGDTKISIDTVSPKVGEFMSIDGIFYSVYSVGDGVILRDLNNLAINSASILNSAKTVYLYTASEYLALTTD